MTDETEQMEARAKTREQLVFILQEAMVFSELKSQGQLRKIHVQYISGVLL
jgi:hypothetical protein